MNSSNNNIVAGDQDESQHIEQPTPSTTNSEFFRSYGTKQSTPIIRSHLSNYQHESDPPKELCFPQRLFRMLNKIDQKQHEEFSCIVSWHSTGMGFVVHKPEAFMNEVLPIFFRSQTKLTSFQRQLNNYGFQRVHEQRKRARGLTYYHRFFLRDHPSLCRRIELKCKVLKKASDTPTSTTQTTGVAIKREKLKLLLDVIPSLWPFGGDSTPTDSDSNVPYDECSTPTPITSHRVVPFGYDCSYPTPTNLVSSADIFQQGDTILDAMAASLDAAAAICGRATNESQQQGHSFPFCGGDENPFVLDGELWDPVIECLDTLAEI